MKRYQHLTLGLVFLWSIAFLLTGSQDAKAVGTASNTDITNAVTVNYSIEEPDGTVTAQTAITDAVTFKVDNLVDLTVVTLETAEVSAVPSRLDEVLRFTVTNTGNTSQDYDLTAATITGGAAQFGGTDAFDMSSVEVYVDANANNTYESATDTATFIDELAANGSVTVFIVADTPAAAVSGEVASYFLRATTHDAGGGGLGALTTEDLGLDDPNAVDVVFGDEENTVATGTLAQDDGSEGDEDGQHVDQADYVIKAAILTVAKTSNALWDPFNLGSNPKTIPGAYVRYVVNIENDATATDIAQLDDITDDLDNNTNFDPDLIDGNSADGTDPNGAGDTDTESGTTGNGVRIAIPSGGTNTRSNVTFPIDLVCESGGADTNLDGCYYTSDPGGVLTIDMSVVFPAEIGYGDDNAGDLEPGESIDILYNASVN